MSSSTPFKPLRAVILTFDKIDLIDFTSPYETLYHARDPATGNKLFRIEIAGPGTSSTDDDNGTMSASQGLIFKQHISYNQVLEELSDVDVLVVPGANWATTERLSNWTEFPVRKIIKEFSALPGDENGGRRPPRVLLSICSGSFFLAVAGILANRRVTTHYLIIKELEQLCAKIYGADAKTEVVRKRFVDVGTLENGVRVVASGGLTDGFDATLYAIELVTNRQEAERVSEILEYPWVRSEALI